MSDCIFCKIVRREAAASIVFEDDDLLAFPTIRQTQPGEVLIIPRGHIDQFCDVPDALVAKMALLAQRLSRVVRDQYRPKRVGWVVSGFGVAHAHLILVPLHNEQDITSERYVTLEEGKVKFGMAHIPETPRPDLDRMARSLALGLAVQRVI